MKRVAGPAVTLSGKTIDTGGKLFDVPANYVRIEIRCTGIEMSAGENFCLRLYNAAYGLVASSYGAGHSKMLSASQNISTSSTFFTIAGADSVDDSFAG